ncbi:MAG: ATP-binding protein, partial [Desulfovermiculus sp.]
MSRYRSVLSRLKFKTKLNLGLFTVILSLGLVLGLITTHIASTGLIQENKERALALASNLAYRSEEPLLARDFLRLKSLVDEVHTGNSDIMYSFILDQSGQVLVHSFDQGFPEDLLQVHPKDTDQENVRLVSTQQGTLYDIAQPIVISDSQLGTVRLGLHRQRLEEMINRLSLTIFGLTGAITVLALGVASWFSNRFTARIKSLTECATEMIKGNLEVHSAPELVKNCWEITGCQATDCPAYGDTRRRCWYVSGTLCPIYHPDHAPRNMQSCRDCPVYRHNVGDEIQELAEAFDYMAMTLNERIQELSATENELSRQKELLQTVLDVTPDMIAFQDRNLAYRVANKAFCSYFRLSESDIIGKTDSDIFSEYQADQNYHEDMQILQTGHSLSKEISVRQGDTSTWFHIVKVPVYDQGVISGLLLAARDITVIKQYQERLIHSQKMEDLGRLAGGVAHEINTPLGIILGYVQMLLDDVDSGSQMAEDLRIVEKQTKICSSIVSDLLGFSRQSATTKGEVDIHQSIQEVISLVEHTFSLNRVQIVTDFDPNIPEIEGDKDRLKQVWMNLFNNASDAIESDGQIRISTKLCAHRRRVAITVADTGSGIKQEVLDKIFDPFFSTKPVGKGTGLGLSVTFGIIKDHGGRINVLSPAPKEYLSGLEDGNSGPGTVFLIELPLWEMTLPDEECEELVHTRG